jgi:hypothetical protein
MLTAPPAERRRLAGDANCDGASTAFCSQNLVSRSHSCANSAPRHLGAIAADTPRLTTTVGLTKAVRARWHSRNPGPRHRKLQAQCLARSIGRRQTRRGLRPQTARVSADHDIFLVVLRAYRGRRIFPFPAGRRSGHGTSRWRKIRRYQATFRHFCMAGS